MTGSDGRHAVVVGGASGIGAAVASLLRERGADVVVADLRTTAGRRGLRCHEESDVVDAVRWRRPPRHRGELRRRVGRMGPITDLPLDTWQGVIDVNLTGNFLCIREELRKMAPQGSGAIVSVSSGAGLRGLAQLPDYVASKHGVIGLVRAAALEHARAGIRINAVAPGSIHTPMLAAFVDGDETRAEGHGPDVADRAPGHTRGGGRRDRLAVLRRGPVRHRVGAHRRRRGQRARDRPDRRAHPRHRRRIGHRPGDRTPADEARGHRGDPRSRRARGRPGRRHRRTRAALRRRRSRRGHRCIRFRRQRTWAGSRACSTTRASATSSRSTPTPIASST